MEEITQNFVTKLDTSQSQLTALWTRVGHSSEEQQEKWRTFVADSLEPFLGNFKQLCYSEEKQLLVENDEMLRELVTLAGHLKTMPQQTLLVDVVRAIVGPDMKAQHGSSLASMEKARGRLPSFAQLLATEQVPPGSAAQEGADEVVAMDAMRHLCFALPTHRQIHQVLTSELKQLNETASIRLAMLRLLHKQRALLQLSPEEQVALRTAYAQKYITQCTPITVWAEDEATKVVDCVTGAVAPPQRPSSQFASARSTDTEDCATEDLTELQLLLTASLYNDANSSTRDTSFCLQPRPTRISAAPLPVRAETEAIEAVACAPEKTANAAARPRTSLFEPDLSDVDRYGKRQDLSMERIREEAAAILREVEQQNEVMQRQTESDVQCAEAAVARWPGTPATQPSRSSVVSQMKEEVSQLQATFAQSLAAAQRSDALAGGNGTAGCGDDYTGTSGGGEQLAEALPASAVVAQCAVPACIRQLLATNSYAPIRACASRYRDNLVRQIVREHRDRTQACHDELCEVARRYASVLTNPVSATTTTTGATTADGTARGAGMPSALARQYDAAMAAVEVYCDDGAQAGADEAGLPHHHHHQSHSTIATVAQLQQSVDGLDQVSELLKGTSRVLQQRLSLLEHGAALLDKRDAILDEKRQMQEGSRERLLSKKINMAKVLLHEENVRRRMAKELPAAMRQLAGLVEEWNRLNESGDETASGTAASLAGWAGPFVVRGVDVAALLQSHADATEDGTGRPGSLSPRPATTTTTAGFAMPTARAPSFPSHAARAQSGPRMASGTASQAPKRPRAASPLTQPLSQRSATSVRSARASPSQPQEPPSVRRRLASPALRPHGVNTAMASTRSGKASHSTSPTPRTGSPVPSVFQRLQSASAPRTARKEE